MTAYEMRSSDWSSDVCSSVLAARGHRRRVEVDDDLATAIVGEGHLLARVGGQGEVGGGVSGGEALGHGISLLQTICNDVMCSACTFQMASSTHPPRWPPE